MTSVKHIPGTLHVPGTSSRFCAFEQKEEMAEQKLAPVCSNVPDRALQTGIHQPYQVSADKTRQTKTRPK